MPDLYMRMTQIENKFEKLLIEVKEVKQRTVSNQTLIKLHAEIMTIFLNKLTLIKEILKILVRDPTNCKLNDLLDELAEEGEFIE